MKQEIRQSRWAMLAALVAVVVLTATRVRAGEEAGPKKESWDYAASCKEVAKKFKGKEGVVVHLGDSITYANPYGAWARYGQGQTEADKAILKWMHCGANDDTDGWWLARDDQPGNRSHTAASGVRADEYLAGGKGGLPKLDDIIAKYNPQMALVMLGTNDASGGRKTEDFIKDMTTIVDKLQANGTIVILSSIPPHCNATKLAEDYNAKLFELAKTKKIPFLDFYGKIVQLEPNGAWNGTIIGKGDVHPTANGAGDAPTDDNFKKSGYLLRGWMSVQKIREVKEAVVGK